MTTCLIAVAAFNAWMNGEKISSRMQMSRMDAVIAVFVRVGAAFGYFDWTSGKQIKKCHFVYSICCRIPGSMKTLP